MKARTARRKALTSAAVVLSVVGITFSTTGMTYRATPSATSNVADLTIDKAYVAGAIKKIEAGRYLTMVWTTKNIGPGTADVEVFVSNVHGMDVVDVSCVTRGVGQSEDGTSCEPGLPFKAGTHPVNYVLTGLVPETATGTVSATVCITDFSDNVDPNFANNCKTLTVGVV